MSADIQFVEVSESSLGYVLSTLGDTHLTNYWAGYFSEPDSDLGASCSTLDVWQNIGGFYLFLDEEPANWTTFETQLLALRPNLGPPNELRNLWIYNVNDSPTNWLITTCQAKASGTGSDIVWTLLRSMAFYLGEYKLSFSGQSPMQYIADEDGGGIKFAYGGRFIGPEGGYDIPEIDLPFSGSELGTFKGTIDVASAANNGTLWDTLNIGLQYASEPTQPIETTESEEDGDVQMDFDTFNPAIADVAATRMLFMPVFNGQSNVQELSLLFDPLNPMEPTRTALSLFPDGTSPSYNFDSHMKTTRGYAIQLAPQSASGDIPSAQFVFGRCPVRTNQVEDGYRYHLSPDGAFKITVQIPAEKLERGIDADSNQLLLGLSGIEYVSLLNANNDAIAFQGGQPAYIPLPDSNTEKDDNISGALTSLATTSHLTVITLSGGSTPVYYAQPKEAPVYSGQGQQVDDPILYFNEMPAFSLTTASGSRPAVFPSGIYAGINGVETVLAQEMENSSIAPYRHYKIGEIYGTSSNPANVPQRRIRATTDPLGVTPQGLVAELTSDYKNFDGLYLGNMPGTNYPKVDLTAVEGKFKQSLQSNQLFFVAANVDELMSCTSNRYQLKEDDKPYAIALGIPESVFDEVYTACGNTVYETEGDFVAAIPTSAESYVPQFLEIAGILKVEMDGWTFQLSPRSWRTSRESPTIMIAKFCERSLLEMVKDTNSWSWTEVAISATTGGSVKGTQEAVLDVFTPATKEEVNESYKIFYETVLIDPTWNGFLFLNAPVDIGEMPNDLKFLTAGIDLTKFYAHHIGFSQTPFNVEDGEPVLEQTAAFGLIDYVDTLDLYAEESIAFGFKTMQLNARFANASLADFSAQVELMINELLAAPLEKNEATRGNNLIINGSYQRVGDAPSYAFALTGENLFNAHDTAITSIEVLSVQLITGGDTNSDEVKTTFILMGNLRFIDLPEFDLFSYGAGEGLDDSFLRYTGFSIDMNFSLATPTIQEFTAREESTGFDQSNSVPRESSLLNNFPLAISGLISSPNLSAEGEPATGQSPEDMGYTSVSAPLDQTPMKSPWFGLTFTLDMGTFGALTGSISFKISILAAWSKGLGQEDPPVYLGLKLPNMPSIGASFPLQGVLKLGFRNFQFETYVTEEDKLGYTLRLRRFALSVLVWSFPPGNADIILFGEPGNPQGSLGWYAAYDGGDDSSSSQEELNGVKKNQPKKKRLEQHRRHQQLKSGRRTPPIG